MADVSVKPQRGNAQQDSSGADRAAPTTPATVRMPYDADMPDYIRSHSDDLPTFGTVWAMLMSIADAAKEDTAFADNLRETLATELRAEIAALRQENRELRDMKAAFAEVRAQAAESASRVAQLDFNLTRIAADRRGPAGTDGKDGKPGPRGPRGERGLGERGIAGAEFAKWDIAPSAYTVVPVMSDGRRGAPLDLTPIIEQAYLDARLTDDLDDAADYVEQRNSEIIAERSLRFRNGG
jgi:hypothetical protein